MLIIGGRALVKKIVPRTFVKRSGEGIWVTIRGRHILFSKDGEIIGGHLPFDDKSKNKKEMTESEVKKKFTSHFKDLHIGKSDKELKQRMMKDVHVPFNSTFTNEKVAAKVITSVINQHFERINKWLKTNNSISEIRLRYQGKNNEVIGRGIRRGATSIKDQHHAIIVLRKKEDGSFIVLTGYTV